MDPINIIKRSFLVRLLIMCVVLVMSSGPAWSTVLQRVGDAAQDFRLVDLEGKERSLSEHRGKVVLLYFWYINKDSYPRDIMEEVQAIHDKLQEKGCVMLTIFNSGGHADVARKYITKHDFTFPVLLDEPYKVGRQFGIDRNGWAVLIDAQGIIRRHLRDSKDYYDLLDMVAQIRK